MSFPPKSFQKAYVPFVGRTDEHNDWRRIRSGQLTADGTRGVGARLNIAARTDVFPGWKQLMHRDGQERFESETLSGQRMGKFQPARVQSVFSN